MNRADGVHADPRDYLAEERTFLAWIRTGIALMGFGLFSAHFGLLPDGPELVRQVSGVRPNDFALWFGVTLLGLGILVNLLSAWRYIRVVCALDRGIFVRAISKQALAVAMSLALLGLILTIYMILATAPSATLHPLL
jgi:putative membrane protein